jgi:hypothetical protein
LGHNPAYTYLKGVNDFSRNQKGDLIAAEHALLYERTLDGKKAILLLSSGSKIVPNLDQIKSS